MDSSPAVLFTFCLIILVAEAPMDVKAMDLEALEEALEEAPQALTVQEVNMEVAMMASVADRLKNEREALGEALRNLHERADCQRLDYDRAMGTLSTVSTGQADADWARDSETAVRALTEMSQFQSVPQSGLQVHVQWQAAYAQSQEAFKKLVQAYKEWQAAYEECYAKWRQVEETDQLIESNFRQLKKQQKQLGELENHFKEVEDRLEEVLTHVFGLEDELVELVEYEPDIVELKYALEAVKYKRRELNDMLHDKLTHELNNNGTTANICDKDIALSTMRASRTTTELYDTGPQMTETDTIQIVASSYSGREGSKSKRGVTVAVLMCMSSAIILSALFMLFLWQRRRGLISRKGL